MEMKYVLFKIFVSVSIFVCVSEGAKILVIVPTPSISHQVPFRPLVRELVRHGHQVTYITTDPEFPKGKAPSNLTEIDLHDLSYEIFRERYLKIAKGKQDDQYNVLKSGLEILLDVYDKQMQTKEIQNIIHGKEEYDLLIVEAFVLGTLAFTHRFKVPVIQISSFHGISINSDTLGYSKRPFIYPQITARRLYNLTFWEKINEIYEFYLFGAMWEDAARRNTDAMKKYFGKDLPSLDELKNRVDMLFLNVHPIFQGNFPVPPSVIHVWGIDNKPEKVLPEDLKTYLDTSEHGVIYFSLGTNTDPANFPIDFIQMFIGVFSELPFDILWKWSKDELPGRSENIKIGKWFPQSVLLKHPKIKLFITQGGLQSTDEAITAGVPLVGIPMLGDQWYNVEKYVHLGIGEKLEAESLTESQLKKAIVKVINDDSYRKNIAKLRDLMQDEPQPPLQRAVWWVEYVLRHGGARHLRAPAANISWAQYYELELILTLVLGVIIVIISVVSYTLYVFYSFVSKKNPFVIKLKEN